MNSSTERSLYDELGPDYTIIRFDPAVRVAGIVAAAVQRGVPLVVLDVDTREARALYTRDLVESARLRLAPFPFS
ncbi:MAG: hypothetical protein HY322_18385 [Betaproteobacteria bacterium]|nr:hypothetical protein [Betaproteobacteria bacterium]